MIFRRIIAVAAISLPAIVQAQQAEKKFRDAASHDQLTLAKQKALQAGKQVTVVPAKGPGPSSSDAVPDLLSRSDILCFGGIAALLPKRAILNLPAAHAQRVNQYQPGSKLVTWEEFLRMNRGWITTHEVTRDQARGKVPLGEKVTEQFKKSPYLTVAIYGGSPVSVLPEMKPETDPSPVSTTKQTSR